MRQRWVWDPPTHTTPHIYWSSWSKSIKEEEEEKPPTDRAASKMLRDLKKDVQDVQDVQDARKPN